MQWEIVAADADSAVLMGYLKEGWEPFAATAEERKVETDRGYVTSTWTQVVYHLRRVETDV